MEEGVMGDAEMEKKRRQKRTRMKTGKEQLETNHTMSKLNTQFSPAIPLPQKYLPPINPDTDFQYAFTNLAALEALHEHLFHRALCQFTERESLFL